MTEALQSAIAMMQQRQFGDPRSHAASEVPGKYSRPIQYLSAMAVVTAALAAHRIIEHFFGPMPPFLLFYPAVLIVALLAGGGPGGLAIFLSASIVDYAMLPPRGSFASHDTADVIALLVFIATNTALCAVAERMRRSRWNQRVAFRQMELLRVTMASIGEGVIATDVDGRILFINGAAETFSGVRSRDAIYQSLEMIFPVFNSRSQEPITGFVDRVLSTGSCEMDDCELELRTQRAGALPIEISGVALRSTDSDVVGVVLTFRDCTERKSAQREARRLLEAAQAEKEWLSQVLNSINDEVYFTDIHARYKFVNSAAMLELESTCVEGVEVDRVIATLSVFRVDGTPRPVEEAPPLRALRGEIIRDEEQIARTPRNGELRHRQVSAVPVRDTGGAIIGSVTVARDITERKRQEIALREADHRKNVFLATLSHELRNPLAPIRTAARLLDSPDVSPAALQRCCTVISRQVAQMASLLDDLLDLSRLTRGELTLKKTYVPLHQVLDAAIETAQPIVDTKNHRLKLDLAPLHVKLEADSVRLTQIVSNLLTNAAKYMDPGGEIILGTRMEPEALVIFVRDHGIGLEGDELDRIFEMFVQVKPSKDRAEGGLGIGLALVKALVELHEGKISVSSDGRERGSTFTVALPRSVVVEAPVNSPSALNADSRVCASRCVLIADDNVDASEMLAILLRGSGHVVHIANDGAAALELAAQVQPDVSVLDIGMPGMNGYELARRIRREAWGGKMTLIAVTGWGQEQDKSEALAAGFDFHLTKPMEPDHLERLLASIH